MKVHNTWNMGIDIIRPYSQDKELRWEVQALDTKSSIITMLKNQQLIIVRQNSAL